jgi:hypothetical protein
MTNPQPKRQEWPDLPFKYRGHALNSEEGTLQVELVVRGTDENEVVQTGKHLMRNIAIYIRK